jgi:hypothetical protein
MSARPPCNHRMRTYLLALAGLGAASAFAPHGLPPPCMPWAAAGPALCLAISRALCCAGGRPQLRARQGAAPRTRLCQPTGTPARRYWPCRFPRWDSATFVASVCCRACALRRVAACEAHASSWRACAAALLPTTGKGRMALRGGAINLRATATAGPKHVTTKSAQIMEEAMVSRKPAASARLM